MEEEAFFPVASQSAGCKSKQNVVTRTGCNLNWLQVKTVVSQGTTVSALLSQEYNWFLCVN